MNSLVSDLKLKRKTHLFIKEFVKVVSVDIQFISWNLKNTAAACLCSAFAVQRLVRDSCDFVVVIPC